MACREQTTHTVWTCLVLCCRRVAVCCSVLQCHIARVLCVVVVFCSVLLETDNTYRDEDMSGNMSHVTYE